MSKVSDAKGKLTAYFKGKGLDPSEIKDAFAELDAADVDLEKLAESTNRNTQWQTFWEKTAVPEFQQVSAERDELKARLAKLEAAWAGKEPDELKEPPGNHGNWKPEEFERKLATATSSVLKSALGIGFKHYKRFGSEPDYNAMEQLMAEGKASSIEDAYRVWSQPMQDELDEKNKKDEIDRRVKEAIQAERSKLGIVGTRKKDTDIEVESYTKIAEDHARKEKGKVPSSDELRNAFLSDLNETASGVVH